MIKARNGITYLIVSLFIFATMWFIKPTITPTPQGIYLPIKPSTHKPTTKKDIVLYQRKPANVEMLGLIHAQYHGNGEDIKGLDLITDFALEKAAEVGANGLVINLIGHSENADYPALSGFEIMSTAIVTPRKP